VNRCGLLEITFGRPPYQLTQQGFPNYSEPMESELNSLEEKIDQFVRLCQQLRSENIQLRQQLAGATSENKHLTEKIDVAASRLEAILAQIPESEK
jgi:cell division protein ZapB